MERCPNCGSEGRHGAKFCTSCGYRFTDENESGDWAAAAAPNQNESPWGASYAPGEETSGHEGWPTSLAAEASGSSWADTASSAASGEPDPSSPPDTEYTGFWPESAPADWASPFAGPASVDSERTSDSSTQAHAARDTAGGAGEVGSQKQALDLADQLRAAIVAIGPIESPDLGGVVSDLEVAATPPGALPQDLLTELREALFAAKENPRDIDTIVDLTRRIDGLVALVIAYDRAMAAIERSLAALKREGDGVSG